MSFKDAQDKAEALDFSRPLDVHKWSDYPEVNKAVGTLFDNLKSDPDFSGNEKLKKKHVKVVVLDLYAAWLSNPDLYIAYHRDANHYESDSRYNKIRISFLTVSVVDALVKAGYVEHHMGFFDRDTKNSAMSRMKATDKLIALIKDEHQVPKKAINKHPNTECIILRDSDKKSIAYNDTRETARMRKQLRAYNELLNRTKIEIPNPEEDTVLGIDQTAKYIINEPDYFVRRIFNNSSWEDGGRFYGGWWQHIPGKLRRQIHINDSKEGCSEIDYSGLHIVMLYAIQGIDYWNVDGEDPYKLPNHANSEQMRQLLKQVLLIGINAETLDKAVSAIQREINYYKTTYGWVKAEQIDIKKLIEAFSVRHSPIKDYLFSGQGIKLQFIDSQLAEKVIEHFTNKDVPVLCVHDSFLIDPLHSNELIQIMVSEFKKVIKDITPLKVDIETTLKAHSHYSDLLEI